MYKLCPLTQKMPRQKFSEVNLTKKEIDHQPDGDGISGLYGIVIEAQLNERGSESFKVGEKWYGLRALDKILTELRRKTKREYILCYMANEIDYGDIAQHEPLVGIIGRPVESLMHDTVSSNNGFFTRNSLSIVLSQSSQIIRDLTHLGFKGLTKDDLYLFCQSPRAY